MSKTAEILELHPAADDEPEAPRHGRIRWASRALSALFTALLVLQALFALLLAAGFLVPAVGGHVGIGPTGMMLTSLPHMPRGYVSVFGLPLVQKLAYLAAGVVVFGPKLLIFWSLRQLFGLYGHGVVFARENALYIRGIGLFLAADAAAPLVVHLVLNALHLAIDQAWMHASSLEELVLGGVVYVIALVMEHGHAIEEEQEQFV